MTAGKFKYLTDRWLMYISRSQFLMVVYLFVKSSEISLWWIVLFFVLSVVFMYFDIKYILPQELDYASKKNPEWMRIFGEKK